jgi:DNA repair exonuclease SbcCD ATPase subunit
MGVTRASLGAFVGRHAQAQALSTYNPAPLIAELEASAADRGRQAEEAREELEAERARETALRSQVAGLLERSKTEANEYGGLRREANALSATQATAVVRRAAEAKRRADTLAKEAALVEAQADQVTPKVREAQLRLEQYENQRKDMLATIADLKTRAATAAQEMTQARQQAEEAGREVAERAAALIRFRTETLAPAGENAARMVAEAVSTARRAGNEGGAAGRLALGTAQHQLADVHLIRAQGLRAFADLMDDLAKTAPALPNAATFASEAEAARATLKELLGQAAEAYRGAQSAYAGVQARAEVRERLQAIAESVEKLGQVAEGESLDILGQYLLPTAPTAEGEVPKALVSAINRAFRQQALGEHDEILKSVIGDDAVKQALRSQFEMTAAFARLDKAAREKLGTGLFDAMGPQLAAMGMSPKALSGQLTADDFEITMVDNRTATATLKGAGPMAPPSTYRLADGRWQLDASSLAGVMAQVAPMLGGMTTALSGLADDVEGGKFTSIQEVMGALQTRMLEAMQGGGGGEGGAGGGG